MPFERGKRVENHRVAEFFERIALLLEIKGEQSYRVLAYRRAADSIRSSGKSIQSAWQEKKLKEIPGVGKAIAEKINELFATGKMPFYDQLLKEVPESLLDLLEVPDIGPKKAARFWKELGIATLEQLEQAARQGKLQQLPGMGAKSEARILMGIEALRRRESDRILLGDAWQAARSLMGQLSHIPAVVDVQAAGSLRRWRETVGDLDLAAASENPQEVIEAFLEFPEVERTRSQGKNRASVALQDRLCVQLWAYPPQHFGSALQYATGSQAHNVCLRELALRKGLSLSEHGFLRHDGSLILCEDENLVYQKLGLSWIPPELREDHGEIQAALEGELPNLIREADLQGDLHVHSEWRDGHHSIEEMALAGLEAGLSYLVISDHSKSLGIANGLSVERLRQQKAAIKETQALLGQRIRILQGAEVEILADGELDYPDEVLMDLDLVIASIHSSLRQPKEVITERYLSAIANPHVDMIGHLTGRLIGRRDPAQMDTEAILQAAAAHGVILEINSHPERFDLNDVHARRSLELGCLLAINSDAHQAEHLGLRVYGLGVARRAWAEAPSIANTWPYERLLSWLEARTKSQ